ncbi:MAG: 50S ribosomal protein L35 [Candidatus Magasanikbacteria bacterium]|nr:50S ribosomal protein L35 [Candidatus Magasanikbacteria bacterium]MCA9390757.1 50S ribosomal protein L35 [Candidatus Magasanikbacteria bacterium]USN52256.1 MAG: 50S ribosomal protein L35 [Candidatus Nomurabacteria bacterium]HPF95202.1 50S ribosomal protein L35 [bacterium]
MKIKTTKAIAKRIIKTKSGKLLKRKGGQGHFNSRESGTVTRNKRRDIAVADQFVRTMKTLTPHN